MADLTQQQGSQTGMTDLINATKGQALNTGALVQSSQNVATQTANLVTQNANLVTQTTNLVTQTSNQVTATNNLTTAVTNLTTAINNALNMGPWNTWSPTVTAGSGTFTSLGTVVARYQAAGKTIYFSLSIPIITNGTAANSINVTLPLTAKEQTSFTGREGASTFKALTGLVNAGSSTLFFNYYDNTYAGANGLTLVMSGVYEAQ